MEAGPAGRAAKWALLLLLSLSMLSAGVRAEDYYVDARSGNDAGDGSAEHPFRTLAPLLQRLGPCDNAYIRVEGAANDQGVGRYSHAEQPSSALCQAAAKKA